MLAGGVGTPFQNSRNCIRTKGGIPNQKRNNMSLESNQDLFTSESKDLYSAQKQALADGEEFEEDEEDDLDDEDLDDEDEEGLEDEEDEEEVGA
jgi:hypothetical protein